LNAVADAREPLLERACHPLTLLGIARLRTRVSRLAMREDEGNMVDGPGQCVRRHA
jgi:hypothetical protein